MVFDKKRYKEKERSITTSFSAGAIAGLVVDVALFPLDTLKTRLQCKVGFWKSGGFREIYKGVGPTAIGSAPSGAIFFTAYNSFKYACTPYVKPSDHAFIHMVGAAIGETAACIVRVPTEVVKQRRQACVSANSAISIVRHTLHWEGVRGLYQGFWSTVVRDVPFAVIQFPLWELFKQKVMQVLGTNTVTPPEGALCGALAGAVAGAITTPLDVVKTRIMLHVSDHGKPKAVTVVEILKDIHCERGLLGFFAGFTPRVTWIFLGGAVFFGVYEEACALIDRD